MRKRAWEKDYFTSALPFTQKGDPVVLPSGATAPVVMSPTVSFGNNDPAFMRKALTGDIFNGSAASVIINGSGVVQESGGYTDILYDLMVL